MIADSVWTKHKNRSFSHDIFISSVRGKKKKWTGWILANKAHCSAVTKGCSMIMSDHVMVKWGRNGKTQIRSEVSLAVECWDLQLKTRRRKLIGKICWLRGTLIEFINKGLIGRNWFCEWISCGMPNLYHDWLSVYSSLVFIRVEGKGKEWPESGLWEILSLGSRKTHGTNSVIK